MPRKTHVLYVLHMLRGALMAPGILATWLLLFLMDPMQLPLEVQATTDATHISQEAHRASHSYDPSSVPSLPSGGLGDGSSYCFWSSPDALKCQIRTLDVEFNTWLHEGLHRSSWAVRYNTTSSLGVGSNPHGGVGVVRSLKVECNRVLFYQSQITEDSFKGLDQMEDLEISHCKLGSLPPDAFTKLPRLRHLQLNSYNGDWATLVLEVVPSSLPGTLEWLSLANNNIWTLPTSLFCVPDSSLLHLNLSYNHLQNLKELGFTGQLIIDLYEENNDTSNLELLEAKPTDSSLQGTLYTSLNPEAAVCSYVLQELVLDHNDIVRIPDGSFQDLQGLQKLFLDSNQIRTISSTAFENLHSLKELYLANNYINSLQNGTFEGLVSLERLYLYNNSLSALDPGIFVGMSELQVIDISRNKLTFTIDQEHIFRDLRRLVILNLSKNSLTTIRSSLFSDLTSLQQLDLSNNYITYIEGGSFESFSNLYTIDISHNQLHTLDDTSFKGLAGVVLINLANNSLTDINESTFHFSYNLKELNISNNFLDSIPNAVGNLSFLKVLDISQNKLTAIEPFIFNGLGNLENLNLSKNGLVSLFNTTFKGLKQILSLDLSENFISNIDEGAFEVAPVLKKLFLSRNAIKDANLLFAALENLRHLDLSENLLTMFDFSFIPRELNTLILSHNQLTKIGNHFKVHHFLTMEYIDASFNKITFLDEISLPNTIQTVKMNNNNISKIETNTFKEKNKIKTVDLKMNNINKINPKTLGTLETSGNRARPELYLSGNPLVCDCEMEWILASVGITHSPTTDSEVDVNYPLILDISELTCSLPHSRGVNQSIVLKVIDTSPESFLCPYATHCFALCHCCNFIACDCQMKCPGSCSCFHDDLWTMNLVDCSKGNLSRLPELVPMDASVVLLDGNNLQTVHAHQFIGRHSIQHLFLNGSKVTILQNRSFHGLTSLKSLHLQDNMIVELRGFEFYGLQDLKELYLQNNRLSFVNNTTFAGLKKLEILRLDNNFIIYFPVWNFVTNKYLADVYLSGNPWDCSCKFVRKMQNWEIEQNQVIKDLNVIYCDDRTIISDYVCMEGQNAVTKYYFGQKQLPFVAGGICGGIAIVSLMVVVAMFIARRKNKTSIKLCTGDLASSQDIDHKVFDAYISYSAGDTMFVRDVLASKLENEYPYRKLCLHSRDFIENHHLSEFIAQSIKFSKRTIIVISKNYLESEWQQDVFRKAHLDAILDKQINVIVIYYDDISESDLEPDLKGIIKKGKKLKWEDKKFWKKLMDNMPNKQKYGSTPMYIGDNCYRVPQSLSNSILTLSTSNLNQSTSKIFAHNNGTLSRSKSQSNGVLVSCSHNSQLPYEAPPPPRPCHSRPRDYIIMQGHGCRDSTCSCQQASSEAYTYVGGDGSSSAHTYSILESLSADPHQLSSRANSPESHHYSIIHGPIWHSLNNCKNNPSPISYGDAPGVNHSHYADRDINSIYSQKKKKHFVNSRTLQPSRNFEDQFSDYTTDQSNTMVTAGCLKHQSHVLYTGLANSPPSINDNSEACFV